MANFTICEKCGRTLDSKFIYCPWCGVSQVAVESEVDRKSFAETVERKRADENFRDMEEIGQRIDALEKELSVLVLSAEMHK